MQKSLDEIHKESMEKFDAHMEKTLPRDRAFAIVATLIFTALVVVRFGRGCVGLGTDTGVLGPACDYYSFGIRAVVVGLLAAFVSYRVFFTPLETEGAREPFLASD